MSFCFTMFHLGQPKTKISEFIQIKAYFDHKVGYLNSSTMYIDQTLNYNTPSLSRHRQITMSNTDEICPLVTPNKISFISMHVPSLVKIPWHLLKLSSGIENMGVSRADNSVKIWRNLAISNPKPDLHSIIAHTKFGGNPLMFSQVIIRKRKYGRVSGR